LTEQDILDIVKNLSFLFAFSFFIFGYFYIFRKKYTIPMNQTVKTLSQIANDYGIHVNTLRRWISPIKTELRINNRKLLLPWQIQKIHSFLNER
jgi:hypothetical protein